jgi:methyl-accepting chemotaxis protein
VATLPVLRAQIREASQDVETAVSSVCASFQAIADRSSETVAKAVEMMGGGHTGGATVAESVDTSRATIARLLQRMERAGEISTLAIARMGEIERAVRGMESLLEEVQKISFTNKIVALNAKIEAVHVGALGAGFEVVAEEITRQAERTTELTGGIASRIQETRDRVRSAAGDLQEFVTEDRAQSVESRRAAEAALQVLFSVHENARESVVMMSSENTRLRDQISEAIVSLQFQDRFGQRVAHVSEALEAMEHILQQQTSAGQVDSENSLLTALHAGYSMHDERVAHARFESAEAPPEGQGMAAQTMEVELF